MRTPSSLPRSVSRCARTGGPPSAQAFGSLVAVGAGVMSVALACGPKPTVAPVLAPAASGSAPASAVAAPTPLPSGLPAALPVPPMGVRGSARARVMPDPAAACPETRAANAAAPASALKQLAEACSLRPSGRLLAGTLGDGESAKSWPFRAKKGQCYRLLVAHEPALQDVVVLLRDSQGAYAVEGPEVAVPASGKVCFDADDDATVLVSVGTGRGAFAVQIVER